MKLRLSLLCVGFFAVQLALAEEFKLTIVHTNDLHAHLEPTKIKDSQLGGYSRVATLVKSMRKDAEHSLFLNAGDTFQGTFFFNMYKGLADVAILNSMGLDAACVGNHEFDLGPKPLSDYCKLANFTVLAANLDVSKEPLLRDVVRPYTMKKMGDGEEDMVGLVGAVTEDLPTISSMGPTVTMKPLVQSVQNAIDQLVAYDVKKVILISHCGYEVEKKLATQLRGVDVIVGGHSHTLIGDVKVPGDTKSGGPYPTVLKNADGDTCLVVQAWEWGKVVGKLEVTFDEEGKIESWSKDQPRAVDANISPDPTVEAIVSAFKIPIQVMLDRELGSTMTEIPRRGPGQQGPMADMICDAMLEATQKDGSVVAFMNVGGVRSALNAGKITFGDAISVQPFNNTLVVIDLTGAEIEESLASGNLYVSAGSSFRSSGGKVTNIMIAGAPLDRAKTYRCTVNSFVANGGDALEAIKRAKGSRVDTGMKDIDAFEDYIKAHSPLDLRPQERIKGD